MPPSADTSLYITLGFEPTVTDVLKLTERDITRAYRRAALRHHPDKNPGDAQAVQRFEKVFLAYETLRSDEKRNKYDQAIKAARALQERWGKMDRERVRMKMELEEREKKAAEDGKKRMKSVDRAVWERMQREIERLRREEREERERERERKKHRYQTQEKDEEIVEKSDKSKVNADWGVWKEVEGFDKFIDGPGGDEEFKMFEKSILNGTMW